MRRSILCIVIFAGLLNLSCENTLESDSALPEIRILSPKNGATLTGSVTIECSAKDNTGIRSLEYFINGKSIGTVNKKPFSYKWSSIGMENGAYRVKARATDLNNNKAESGAVEFYIDNSGLAPSPVNITSISYTRTLMTIIWETSKDSNFAAYNLYYSDSENGPKTLITATPKINRTDNSHVIMDFNPAIKRWYWVEVKNALGYTSFGKPYAVLDAPPAQVSITSITYTNNALTINWTRSNESDFASYTVYEYSIGDTSSFKQLRVINEASGNKIILSGNSIEADKYKYYRVHVKDYWQLESKSPFVIGSTYPNKILFQKNDVLYTSNNLGDDAVKLTDKNAGENTSPLFSPDGSQIYYLAASTFNVNEIYKIDIDGSNETELTDFSFFSKENPALSSDGADIVFIQGGLVRIISSDGGTARTLTANGSTSAYPVFTPSNSRIVYLFKRSGNYYDLMIMDQNGENKQQRTSAKTLEILEEKISVSPGGGLVACVVQGSSSKEIYTVSIDGSVRNLLVNNISTSISNVNPQFSPDGTKILYENNGIYIINTTGSGSPVKISDGRNARFTPDGSKIIFVRGSVSGSYIYIYDLEEKYTIRISQTAGTYSNPAFQP